MKKLVKLTAIMLVALMAMPSIATAKKSHSHRKAVSGAAARKATNYNYTAFVQKRLHMHMLLACKRGDLATVKRLVEAQAVNLNESYYVLIWKKDGTIANVGNVPVEGHTSDEVLTCTCTDGKKYCLVSSNYGSVYDYTPLMMAAEFGHLDVVKYLVAHGANINYHAVYETPLNVAAYYRHYDVVKYLVEAGADHLDWALAKVPEKVNPNFHHPGAGSYQEGIKIINYLVSKGAAKKK